MRRPEFVRIKCAGASLLATAYTNRNTHTHKHHDKHIFPVCRSVDKRITQEKKGKEGWGEWNKDAKKA